MNQRPASDLYPPYSGDYYMDMQKWKEQTGCEYPECNCIKLLVKGTCKHEEKSVLDMNRDKEDVQF